MRNVLQGKSATSEPLEPLARQTSAWSSNPSVKRAVITLWCLIPVYVVWGAIVYALSIHASEWEANSSNVATAGTDYQKLSESSWALSPNENTQSFSLEFWGEPLTDDESASLPRAAWPLVILAFMVVQSGLTLGLHYCEAIINTTRDEHIWRQAASSKGVPIAGHGPLRAALGSWRSVFLLVIKPFLRE